jgi:hypothetical protein
MPYVFIITYSSVNENGLFPQGVFKGVIVKRIVVELIQPFPVFYQLCISF